MASNWPDILIYVGLGLLFIPSSLQPAILILLAFLVVRYINPPFKDAKRNLNHVALKFINSFVPMLLPIKANTKQEYLHEPTNAMYMELIQLFS